MLLTVDSLVLMDTHDQHVLLHHHQILVMLHSLLVVDSEDVLSRTVLRVSTKHGSKMQEAVDLLVHEVGQEVVVLIVILFHQ